MITDGNPISRIAERIARRQGDRAAYPGSQQLPDLFHPGSIMVGGQGTPPTAVAGFSTSITVGGVLRRRSYSRIMSPRQLTSFSAGLPDRTPRGDLSGSCRQ